jgi:anaphase-promoting complex subunit 6
MAQQGYRGMAQVSPRVRPSPRADVLSVPAHMGPSSLRQSRSADADVGRDKNTSPRKRASRDEEDTDDSEAEQEKSWGMVDSMRLWRHDAIMQHLYETAAFWGDKILSWTGQLVGALIASCSS